MNFLIHIPAPANRERQTQRSVERMLTFKSAKVSKIKLLLEQGMSIRNICNVVECSPNYIYKVKNRLDEVVG